MPMMVRECPSCWKYSGELPARQHVSHCKQQTLQNTMLCTWFCIVLYTTHQHQFILISIVLYYKHRDEPNICIVMKGIHQNIPDIHM